MLSSEELRGTRAYGRHVLARVLEGETRVGTGGLWIPGSARGRANQAEVLSVGPLAEEVSVGDRIIFDAYAILMVMAAGQIANASGTPIANPGDCFFVDVDSVWGVVETPPSEECRDA